MIFEQISVGGDRNYSYIVAEKEGGEAAIIDPSFMHNRITGRIITGNSKALAGGTPKEIK